MPPKAKFSKNEVICAALRIVERDGEDSLTARSLGAELGSSARPVFTVFNNMDEVFAAVVSRANAVYGEYVEEGLKETPSFKGVGKAYIRFAAERPRLFRLLFMREREDCPDMNTALRLIEEHYNDILYSITNTYSVDEDTAKQLYFHSWVYSHGIAVLTATKVCRFSEEEVSAALTVNFGALIRKIKTEGNL